MKAGNHLFALFYALKRRLELMPRVTTSRDKTRALTEEILRFCEHERAGFACEVPIEPIEYRSSGKLRHGFVDAFIRTNKDIVFAIEIDRGNKMWSLDKLQHCCSRYNAIPIWVRWSGVVDCPIPPNIAVVDLTGNTLTIWNDHIFDADVPPRTTKPPPNKKIYSVAEIRNKHPNAYARWSEDDDAQLLSLHRKGMGSVELSAIFKRQIGAITSRLGHLLDE